MHDNEYTDGYAAIAQQSPTGRVSPLPDGSNVGYGLGIEPRPDIDYSQVEERVITQMADMSFDDLKAGIAEADLASKGRMMMVGLDPILRTLPFEQRTAVLLNLLVTYAAEEPAVLAHRGKAINALTNDFKMRLQQYLPIKTD